MSDFLERISRLSPKRLTFLAAELNSSLERLKQQQVEPLAVIGMGCRFPGSATDPEALWQLFIEGHDAVEEVPAERWDVDAFYDPDPDAIGKMSTRWGGFLTQIDQFDPDFFGISPREAAGMDPQQRLLLEVVWEALEHAGQSPAHLKGSRTGVFAGLCNGDYYQMTLAGGPDAMDAYVATGNSHSIASGRISYLLGLQGPSLSIDTACSSSLVAVHLACQSLRAGECRLALAGGVNLMLTPEPTIILSKAHMMSPAGRCKAFDASADGFVRAEGCGVVVLKRLSDARADGDRILALIRGTASNQDGRSSGLTAPNGPSQVAVIRDALENAGLQPADIELIEAHGTGTSLGDPIEAGALAEVFGPGRDPELPLRVGSSKSNFGHAESAAGIGGLIKAVLALEHGEIPPSLHMQRLNPHIGWEGLPFEVPVAPRPWIRARGQRIAGVSSFGFSGTNAHVIVSDVPDPIGVTVASAADGRLSSWLLPLSARTETALVELAGRYARVLEERPELDLADVCRTAGAGRTHFEHRLAVVAGDVTEARVQLAAFRHGTPQARTRSGRCAVSAVPGVVFMFTGQGAQYVGMGRELFETQPVFRRELERCAEILQPLLGESLLERVLYPPRGVEAEDDPSARLEQTRYTQPALFALEYALAMMWRSWGIEPVAVLGHSVGEYVAACIAGVFSLEDGLRLIAERGRLMASLPAGGAMAAVFADAQRVADALDASGASRCAIACLNGPANVVVAGDGAELDGLLERLREAGIDSRRLSVSHAFHSPLMEPMLDAFERVAAEVQFAAPRIAVVSNLTGDLAAPALMTSASYWRRHIREPVRFAASIEALRRAGHDAFLEIGPHPVLTGMAQAGGPDADQAVWAASLHRERRNWDSVLEAAAALYVRGVELEWEGVYAGTRRRPITLPSYPFQRRRFWLEADAQPARVVHARPDESWRNARAAGLRQSASAPLGVNVGSYPEKWRCLERLTVAHAADVLRSLGAFAQPGEAHDAASLIERLGVSALYRHLLHKWLERLASAGLLRVDGNRFVSDAPLPSQDVAARTREAEQMLADDPHLLAFVRHCAGLLTQVLSGTESPLEMLFPGGSYRLSENLYEGANMNRYANTVAGAVVEAAARVGRPDRPFRVLEIGAGTGGTSATLLPLLDPERSLYVFSDVSDAFLTHARRKFATFPFARFIEFDLDKELASQGVSEGTFDVIVGANVVHAVRDLKGALRRLSTLLRPGGFLLLIELTRHHAWLEISAGLVEGWQHFADDLRGSDPLLSAQQWEQALAAHGFSEIVALPESDSPAMVLGQHVILARTPPAAHAAYAAEGDLPAALGALEAHTAAPQDTAVDSAEAARALCDQIAAAPEDERLELMIGYVRERVMEVLRLDHEHRPDRRHRLMDLGLDSLMAVQLRNRLEAGLRVTQRLPATLMFDYPTIESIADFLLQKLFDSGAATVAAQESGAAAHAARAREIEALSDDEAEALLLERLGRS